MTGGNATTTLVTAFDIIGELRNQVLGLQDWVRALIGDKPVAADKPKGD